MEKARMLGMEEAVAGVPATGNGKLLPDPAVLEKPVRRRFTADYKLRILQEADCCTASGQLGALLRREGLYSSLLSTWRRQRDEGTLAGLTPKRRGRKAMKPLALCNDANFGAQYLHLRCGRSSAVPLALRNLLPPYAQSSVLTWWLAFGQVGLSN